jgi:hypothetical protein
MRYGRAVIVGLAALGFAGMFVPGRSAAEGPGSSVAAWVDSLAFDDGAIAEIELFAKEKRSEIESGYARELSEGIRRLMSAGVREALDRITAGERTPFIDVSVVEPGFASAGKTPPDDSVQREFEKSFVRTEFLEFFPDEDTLPRAALAIYTTPDFRQTAMPRIERIWNEGGEVCVEIRGVKLAVDPVSYCDHIENHHEEGLSVQHTQAVRNAGGSGHQTVYFKESLKVFIRLPDGLVFYYLNYSRTIGLGGIRTRLALGQIKKSEKNAIEELGHRLAADSPKPAE